MWCGLRIIDHTYKLGKLLPERSCPGKNQQLISNARTLVYACKYSLWGEVTTNVHSFSGARREVSHARIPIQANSSSNTQVCVSQAWTNWTNDFAGQNQTPNL